MRPKLYLAGPISGLEYEGATDWRESVHEALSESIDVLSPMRLKEHLSHEAILHDRYENANVLSTPRGIMSRDHFDVRRADALLVNLAHSRKVSIGTVMEMAWAYDDHKPIVGMIDERHRHAMLDQTVSFPVATLAEAIEVAKAILLP